MSHLRLLSAFFLMAVIPFARAQAQDRQLFDGGSDAVMHNETFFCLDPNIGVEFALTPAVHLTFKTDWLIPLPTRETPSGARFYLGVVFAH